MYLLHSRKLSPPFSDGKGHRGAGTQLGQGGCHQLGMVAVVLVGHAPPWKLKAGGRKPCALSLGWSQGWRVEETPYPEDGLCPRSDGEGGQAELPLHCCIPPALVLLLLEASSSHC